MPGFRDAFIGLITFTLMVLTSATLAWGGAHHLDQVEAAQRAKATASFEATWDAQMAFAREVRSVKRAAVAQAARVDSFDPAVAAANELLSAARGKSTATGATKALIATLVAAHAVVEGDPSAEEIEAQAGIVTASSAALANAIGTYDAEHARIADEAVDAVDGLWRTTSRDGEEPEAIYARYRAVLNEVGGSWVTLEWVPGAKAYATLDRPGVISIGEKVGETADWGAAYGVYWVMRHELAHLYQIEVGFSEIEADSQFQRLYLGDMEHLANCMAIVMGSPNGASCAGETRVFAESILAGTLP